MAEEKPYRNWQETDSKWQKRWADAHAFEPAINEKGKEKFFLTPAFPYPNSPQHIGHGRTYTTTDIYARYLRMKGKNVLFPMAFHVTGTPILAMARRIEEKDKEILGIFEKIYNIPRKTSETLTDPRELVAYFSREIEQGMREMGYSIDWRRKFYSYDAHFNRFIHWQFAKLNQAGLITKGTHPVPWCPKADTAVGAHDTKGDIDPEIAELAGVLFPFSDGFLMCATYRSETITGVTNIWLNEKAAYVKATDGKRNYYVAKEAVPALSMQLPLKVLKEYSAQELAKMKAKNPANGAELPIFFAGFVEPDVGSGVVMSVPGHAPYDYLALRDANLLEKIKPIQVLKVEGFGEFPAKDIIEKMGVKDQHDPKAEEATHELYKLEAHTGVMAQGEFAGLKGMAAKEKIVAKMMGDGSAIRLYEISNAPIHSRFGGLVCVKMVQDQWFIDYGNPEWKRKAHECLNEMRILPEKSRKDYEYTIDWLREKACTRSAGLGTRFPFDETKMIEALSDSTIYMAFYTISHIARKLGPEQLTEQLFDYVFLAKGDGKGLPPEAKEMRAQFEYFYPLDSRHSATDLVRNHLPFFIFNHTAIFPKKHWPRQIIANGFVLMDGKKMSKSMGNIMPIRDAMREFGADAIRFVVVSGADLASDTDFNRPAVEGVLSRMRFFESLIGRHAACGEPDGEPTLADRWILSAIHRRALAADSMYREFQHRELALELFYSTANDLQWYLRQSDAPRLREFFELWVPLIAPFMPHFAEEMWEKLGRKKYAKDAEFVSLAPFPKGDRSKVDESLGKAKDYADRVREDINSILKLIKMDKPESIRLFVASGWKRKLREIAAKEKKFDSAMKLAMQDDGIKKHGKDVVKVLTSYMKNVGSLGETPSEKFELDALREFGNSISAEFGAKVSFSKEEGSEEQKAKNALPGKPSILVS